jgi:hypothetical protein
MHSRARWLDVVFLPEPLSAPSRWQPSLLWHDPYESRGSHTVLEGPG